MKHYGDITKISGYHVPPVNVVIGGSPCQDLSVAGKRVGLAGERSGLFMEQIRLIKEMRLADEQRGNSGGVSAPVSWSGKTYRELLAPTEAQTLAQFYKKRSGSSSRKHPMCLCLTVDGQWQDACSGQTAAGLSRGGYLMRSFGESPSAAVVSRLSQILEETPHPKYFLSATACAGILRRAEKRGKELPEILRAALIRQSQGALQDDMTEAHA